MDPYQPMTLEGLARLWSVDVAELTRTVSSVPRERQSPLLRSLAESLRFIGLVRIASVSGDSLRVIEPFVGHYYHMSPGMWERVSVGGPVLGEPIEIGRSTVGTVTQVVQIIPFKSIPRTADLRRMASSLSELIPWRTRPEESIIRWVSEDPAAIDAPTPLVVKGWRTPPVAFSDLFLYPLVGGQGEAIELQGYDSFAPMLAFRPNGILSMLGDDVGVTSWQPAVVSGVIEAEGIIPT